jgi:hypothetical protein
MIKMINNIEDLIDIEFKKVAEYKKQYPVLFEKTYLSFYDFFLKTYFDSEKDTYSREILYNIVFQTNLNFVNYVKNQSDKNERTKRK